ncbi:MAG TPA: ABC-type transport auxiliary lipoprotein family protein [Acetobacteraceae bacterium]
MFPPSAPQLYTLTPRIGNTRSGPLVHDQLVVVVPVAPESLDTERIALTRDGILLDYFAGSAWTDRAPAMLQGLLVDALQNSGRIVAVGRGSSDISPDYLLETELRDFEARYTGPDEQPPTIVVRVVGQLIKASDRKVIASVLATAQVRAAHNDLGSVVGAFDTAVGDVLTQIVNTTLQDMSPGGAARRRARS